MDFLAGGSIIMDYRLMFFGQKQWFEVKNILMTDLFLTNTQLFTSQDVNWWTGVVWITSGLLWCFYQMFGLSFWRHPFTAEDPLLSKWWNATFLQIWWRNKLTSWMAWGWEHFQQMFNFGWTTPLKREFIIYSPPCCFKLVQVSSPYSLCTISLRYQMPSEHTFMVLFGATWKQSIDL